MPPAHLPGRLAVGLAVLAAAVLISTGPLATPAQAHDQLVETSPEEGQVVEEVPAEIMLRFTQPVIDLSARVLVRDATDEVVVDVEATVDRDVVTAPLPADLADGTYTVSWRVVSADGHPIQGAYDFHVREPTAPSAEPTSGPLPIATGRPAPAAGPPSGLLLGGAALVLVAAAVAGVLVRRRTTP